MALETSGISLTVENYDSFIDQLNSVDELYTQLADSVSNAVSKISQAESQLNKSKLAATIDNLGASNSIEKATANLYTMSIAVLDLAQVGNDAGFGTLTTTLSKVGETFEQLAKSSREIDFKAVAESMGDASVGLERFSNGLLFVERNLDGVDLTGVLERISQAVTAFLNTFERVELIDTTKTINNFSKLATGLEKLAKGMLLVRDQLKDDQIRDAIEKIGTAIEKFQTLENELNKELFVKAVESFETFSNSLNKFANAFDKVLDNLNISSFTKFSDTVESSFLSLFTAIDRLDPNKLELLPIIFEDVGDSIKLFVSGIQGINNAADKFAQNINQVADGARILSDAFKSIENIGGAAENLRALADAITSLARRQSSVAKFVESINDIVNAIKNINANELQGLVDVFSSISGNLSELAEIATAINKMSDAQVNLALKTQQATEELEKQAEAGGKVDDFFNKFNSTVLGITSAYGQVIRGTGNLLAVFSSFTILRGVIRLIDQFARSILSIRSYINRVASAFSFLISPITAVIGVIQRLLGFLDRLSGGLLSTVPILSRFVSTADGIRKSRLSDGLESTERSLKNLNSTVNANNNILSRLPERFKAALDSVLKFNRGVNQTEVELSNLSIDRVTSNMQRLGAQFLAVDRTIDTVLFGVERLGSAFRELIGFGIQVIQQNEALERSLTSFAAIDILDSGETDDFLEAYELAGDEAQRLNDALQQIAIQSPFGRAGIVEIFNTARTFGFASDQATVFTQRLADFGAISGNTTASLSELQRALGQIASTGFASLEDLSQINDRSLPIFRLLAEEREESVASLREAISAREVTAKETLLVINDFLSELEGAASSATTTITGVLATFNDFRSEATASFVTGLLEPLRQLGADTLNLESLRAVQAFSRQLGDTFASFLGPIITRTIGLLSLFFNSWQALSPRIQNIILLMLQFGTVAVSASTSIAIITKIVTVLGINFAAFLSPLGLAIAGFVTLTTVILQNREAITSYSTTLSGQLVKLLSDIPSLISTITNVIGQGFTAGFANISSSFEDIATALEKLGATGFSAFTREIGELFTQISTLGSSLQSGLESGINAIISFVQRGSNTFAQFAIRITKYGADTALAWVSGFASVIDSAFGQLATLISNIVDYWFAPNSPPRVAPNIDEYGGDLVAVWMEGMANRSREVIGKTVAFIQSYLAGQLIRLFEQLSIAASADRGLRERLSAALSFEVNIFNHFSDIISIFSSLFVQVARVILSGEKPIQDGIRKVFDISRIFRNLTARAYADIVNIFVTANANAIETFGTQLGGTLANFTRTIGSALQFDPSAIEGFIDGFWTFFSRTFFSYTFLIRDLVDAAFITIFLGPIAGISTLVGNVLVANLDQIVAFFQNFLSSIQVFGSNADTVLVGVFRNLGERFRAFNVAVHDYGVELAVVFAEGIVAAVGAVIDAINVLGGIFADWMAPQSPPRFLPDIDQWATDTASVYLEGFNSADFSLVNEFADQIEDILDLQNIEGVNVQAITGNFASLLAGINAGEGVDETLIEQIVGQSGTAGEEIRKVTELYIDLVAEQTNLNRLTDEYENRIDGIGNALNRLDAEEGFENTSRQIESLNALLSRSDLDSAQRAALEKQRNRLTLQQQQERLEIQKANSEAAVEGIQEEINALDERERLAGRFQEEESLDTGSSASAGKLPKAEDLEDLLPDFDLASLDLGELDLGGKIAETIEESKTTIQGAFKSLVDNIRSRFATLFDPILQKLDQFGIGLEDLGNIAIVFGGIIGGALVLGKLGLFNTALGAILSPIGLVIGGALAIGAVFAGDIFSSESTAEAIQKITDKLNLLKESFGVGFSGAEESQTESGGPLAAFIAAFQNDLTTIEGLAETVGTISGLISLNISNLFGGGEDEGESNPALTGQELADVAVPESTVTEAQTTIAVRISNGIAGGIATGLRDAFESLINIEENVQPIIDKLDTTSIGQQIEDKFREAFGLDLSDTLTGILEGIQGFVDGLFGSLEILRETFNRFADGGLINVLDAHANAVQRVFDVISSEEFANNLTNLGILIGGFVLLVTGIADAILIVLGPAVIQTINDFLTSVSNIVEGVIAIFTADSISEAISGFGQVIAGLFGILGTPANFIANIFKNLVAVINDLIGGALDPFIPAINLVIDVLSAFFGSSSAVLGIIGRLTGGFARFLPRGEQLGNIVEFVFTKFETLRKIGNTVAGFFVTLFTRVTRVSGVFNRVQGAIDDFVFRLDIFTGNNFVATFFNGISRSLTLVSNNATRLGKGIVNALPGQEIIDSATETFAGLASQVSEFFGVAIPEENIFARIKTLTDGDEGIITLIGSIITVTGELLETFAAQFPEDSWIGAIIGFLGDMVTNIGTVITEFGKLSTTIFETGFSSESLEALGDLVVSIKDGATGALEGIIDFATKIKTLDFEIPGLDRVKESLEFFTGGDQPEIQISPEINLAATSDDNPLNDFARQIEENDVTVEPLLTFDTSNVDLSTESQALVSNFLDEVDASWGTEGQRLRNGVIELFENEAASEENIAALQTLGNELGIPIPEGIIEALGDPENSRGTNVAIRDLMAQILEAGKEAIDAQSPSQLAKDELGTPIPDGIILGITEGQETVMQSLVNLLNNSFVEAASVLQGSTVFAQLFTSLFTNAGEAITQLANQVGAQFATVETRTVPLYTAYVTSLLTQTSIFNTQVITLYSNTFAAIIELFIEFIEEVLEYFEELYIELVEQLEAFVEAWIEQFELLESETRRILNLVIVALRNFGTEVERILENAARNAVDGFISELEKITDRTTTVLNSFLSNIAARFGLNFNNPNSTNTTSPFYRLGSNIGVNILEGLAEAMTDNFGRVVEPAIEALCDEINAAFLSCFGIASPSRVIYENVGVHIPSALALAMLDGIPSVVSAADTLAMAVVETMEDVLQIASPSKLVRERIGHNVGDAVGYGLLDKRGDIISAASKLSDDLHTNLSGVTEGYNIPIDVLYNGLIETLPELQQHVNLSGGNANRLLADANLALEQRVTNVLPAQRSVLARNVTNYYQSNLNNSRQSSNTVAREVHSNPTTITNITNNYSQVNQVTDTSVAKVERNFNRMKQRKGRVRNG